jgi:hypothetical protein
VLLAPLRIQGIGRAWRGGRNRKQGSMAFRFHVAFEKTQSKSMEAVPKLRQFSST